MATVIWSTFAVGILIAIFAGCVIVVAAGIRLLENRRAKRHRSPVA